MSDVINRLESPEVNEALEVIDYVRNGGNVWDLKDLDRDLLFSRAHSALEMVEPVTVLNFWVDMTARQRIPGHQSDTVSKSVTFKQKVIPFESAYGDFELALTDVFRKPNGEAYVSASGTRIVLCEAGKASDPHSPGAIYGLTLAQFGKVAADDALVRDNKSAESILALFE